MNYKNITLEDLIGTFWAAQFESTFIGFICDADTQTVDTEFEVVN